MLNVGTLGLVVSLDSGGEVQESGSHRLNVLGLSLVDSGEDSDLLLELDYFVS